MLQPAMGPPTPVKPLLPHPAKAFQGRQRATGHAATAGAVRSLDAVACGCAATPDPPEWSQAGAGTNYRSCSLVLGRCRLSSLTSPPQPVALVLAERTREKMCSGWTLSLGDKVHRGGVHRPFAHAFSQSAGTQVANAKAVCGATSRMQTKMRVRIRTLLETA